MRRVYNNKLSAKANEALNRRYITVQIERFMLVLIIVVAVSLVVFLSSTLKAFAGSSQEELPMHKYYKSITVEKGDTLWNIAKENASSDIDLNDYIKEVRDLNNIASDDIHSGQTLIVAYYSSDIQ